MLSLTSQTVGATQGSCFPSPRAITGSKEWAAQFKLNLSSLKKVRMANLGAEYLQQKILNLKNTNI